MKKALGILFVILIVLGMAGCDLNPLNKHTQYFYSLTGEWETPSYKTLNYRSDGHTIIMSRSKAGPPLTKEQADALNNLSKTEFSLTLDGNAVDPLGPMTVAELDRGYHVVQSFPLGVMDKGTHTLVGVTYLRAEGEGGTRTDTVHLTIK
ncbi:MAG: hypothetical protein RBR15_14080 [Sphaerochaeta sp.]|nr:hypothetical protein [Sphaerochaeta sp.]